MKEIFKKNDLTQEEIEGFKSFLCEDLKGKELVHQVVHHRKVFKQMIKGKTYYIKWFKLRKKLDPVKIKMGIKKTRANRSYLKASELEKRFIRVIKPVYVAENLPYSICVTRDVEELGFFKYENKEIGKKGIENISSELLDGYLELLKNKVYHYDYHLENFVFRNGLRYHLDLDDMKVLTKEKNSIMYESLYNYLKFIDSRDLDKNEVLIEVMKIWEFKSGKKMESFKRFLKKRKKTLHDSIEWSRILSS